MTESVTKPQSNRLFWPEMVFPPINLYTAPVLTSPSWLSSAKDKQIDIEDKYERTKSV
jgi:hypothetical protein